MQRCKVKNLMPIYLFITRAVVASRDVADDADVDPTYALTEDRMSMRLKLSSAKRCIARRAQPDFEWVAPWASANLPTSDRSVTRTGPLEIVDAGNGNPHSR